MNLEIVYLLPNWQYLEYVLSCPELNNDPENDELRIANMICTEIKICKKNHVPVYYIVATNTPQQFSIDQNGQCHDYEYQLFDQHHNAIASLNENLLLRSSCAEIEKPLSYLKSLGGSSILTWQDECAIANWHKHISLEFTKRKILEITKAQLNIELLNSFSERDRVFIKSKTKNFGIITDTNISHFDIANSLAALPDDEILIISEPLDLCCDEHGPIEYRVWVSQYQMISISRYIDEETQYDTHKDINKFVERFITKYKDVFPAHYILDVGVDYNVGFSVIELNGMIASGRYYHNNFDAFLKVLKQD
ncbi:ATP-grasp domain-containing protein [Candidatus Uabimicrobium sp. HlEnr_7]|uniref:ATP-grasp domain-containing protein n=1 Tax=Candidatus Uabimicrobium helgolandensis TaxID=3095367 RepID=UPI0035581135